MNVFDRYAPFVQDFIYRNNWESLRAIQAARPSLSLYICLNSPYISPSLSALFFFSSQAQKIQQQRIYLISEYSLQAVCLILARYQR